MKDFVTFDGPQEAEAFIRALWRTDAFRDSHKDPSGYVHDLVHAVVARPLFFHNMTAPSIEWSHFSTWFGTVALREYDNDALHDLYYLHEFVHFATLDYDADVSFAQWHGKLCRNEMLASTHSEAYVHLVLPTLRKEAFSFELWMDRFLEGGERAGDVEGLLRGGTLDELDRDDEATCLGFLFAERHQAMMLPDPFDFTEMQIAKYGKQNFGWSQIWQGRFREVESRMARLHADALADPRGGVARHIDWLNEMASGDADRVPFRAEAETFRNAVLASDARWGNDLLKK